MTKTKIILQQTFPQLGLVGDVVDVAPGYYRNYLAPRNLALLANPKSIKQLEHHKKVIEAKKLKEKTGALELKTKIEGSPFSIAHSAGAGDKLFGSITSKEIARICLAGGFIIDRKMVQLENPIKNLGIHEVGIKLHPDVTAVVKIEVLKKEEEKKEEAVEEKKRAPKEPKRKVKKAEEQEETKEEAKEEEKKEEPKKKIKTAAKEERSKPRAQSTTKSKAKPKAKTKG